MLVCVVLVWAALHFVKSAPPHTLTISSGPKGSSFDTIAQRYSAILARSGVQLKVVPSAGSLENLNRLTDGGDLESALNRAREHGYEGA